MIPVKEILPSVGDHSCALSENLAERTIALIHWNVFRRRESLGICCGVFKHHTLTFWHWQNYTQSTEIVKPLAHYARYCALRRKHMLTIFFYHSAITSSWFSTNFSRKFSSFFTPLARVVMISSSAWLFQPNLNQTKNRRFFLFTLFLHNIHLFCFHLHLLARRFFCYPPPVAPTTLHNNTSLYEALNLAPVL